MIRRLSLLIRLGGITIAGASVLGLAIGGVLAILFLPCALLGRWLGWF